MKKRWFFSLVAIASSGVYVMSKLVRKEKNEDETQRKALVEHFEKQGYKVHVYNENNDFMLFHQEKNEKRHLFYDDGLGAYENFRAKLHAYYLHFTNEFYFVCKNEAVLEQTKQVYHEWSSSLQTETLDAYGATTASFITVDALLNQ